MKVCESNSLRLAPVGRCLGDIRSATVAAWRPRRSEPQASWTIVDAGGLPTPPIEPVTSRAVTEAGQVSIGFTYREPELRARIACLQAAERTAEPEVTRRGARLP